MENITVEVVRDGNIEQCRELCNELMAFQKAQAKLLPEVFDMMDFDSRMKTSFAKALDSQVIVVKDNGVPVGYAFSTIETVVIDEASFPPWTPRKEGEKVLGFYPEWANLTEKVGVLSNIYLRDAYRSLGLGSKLFDMSMEWLESFEDLELIFIYISNGNKAALDFYLHRGFTYSHEVFGGFIQAVYKRV